MQIEAKSFAMDLDRALLLFCICAMILFISFLVLYLLDRNFRIQELVDSLTKELKIETERSMQGLHLLNLLDDTLDMARIDAKDIIFKPTQVTEKGFVELSVKEIPSKKWSKDYKKNAKPELFDWQQLNIESTELERGVANQSVVDQPLSVLIVEDDASNRILFQAYLKNKKKWTVDYAHHGISALQDFLETKKYDVMVTDLQMPEMDGFTLISKLDSVHKPDRIIILSADSTKETALRAQQFKVDQFITKPVHKKEFIDAIQG
jgi:CheY-like chemotaxis protein